MVRGHQREGFPPHPQRFQGKTPRSRRNVAAEPNAQKLPIYLAVCLLLFVLVILVVA